MKVLRQLSLVASFLGLAITVFAAENVLPQDVTIHRDNIALKGNFYSGGQDEPTPTILLLNGFPGNETDVLGLGARFSEAGYNALTFNYSGTYESEGEWSFINTQADIQAAFDFLTQPGNVSKYHIDTSRIYLGGWSFGGGMTLTYAARHPEVRSVFSIAGTDHGAFMREYFRNPQMASWIDDMFEKLKAPNGPVRFGKGAMPKEATPALFAILDSTLDIARSAPLLKDRNILLIGGWDDSNNRIEDNMLPDYRALRSAGANQVRMAAFQDTHGFRHSRAALADTIISWMKKDSR